MRFSKEIYPYISDTIALSLNMIRNNEVYKPLHERERTDSPLRTPTMLTRVGASVEVIGPP